MTHKENTKQVYVILGMARSGTSIIARGLKAIGIELGDQLTPASKWNPKGFWEDNEIVYQVNEKVLATLQYTWDSTRLVDSKALVSEILSDLKKYAAILLEKRLKHTDYWGFKDPRTTKILPFWQAIFKAANVCDHYIIALRHPLSAAQSYQRLTGTEIEHGLLLWATNLLAAIDETAGKNRVVVSYDLLMSDPRKQLERLKKCLNLPALAPTAEIDAYISHFLDRDLQHYKNNTQVVDAGRINAVFSLTLDLYTYLLQIAQDEITFSDPQFQLFWQEMKNEYRRMATLYDYIDKLIQDRFSLQKTLRTLHKSRLWKLIYPLRQLDGTLRAYRQHLKTKRAQGIRIDV